MATISSSETFANRCAIFLSVHSEYPSIFRVTGVNHNTQKLLSTALENTNYYYGCTRKFLLCMCKKGKICTRQKLKLTATKLSNTSISPQLNPLCKHFITLHKFVCVVVFCFCFNTVCMMHNRNQLNFQTNTKAFYEEKFFNWHCPR